MNALSIQIEVNLGEPTLNLLQKFMQFTTKPSEAPTKKLETKSQEPEVRKIEPAPAANATDDMGELPFVTNEELRAAVKIAKDATSAADVKAIFANYGIKTSIECPEDKRQALLNDLNKLANN